MRNRKEIGAILEGLNTGEVVSEGTSDFNDFQNKHSKWFSMCDMPEELCDPYKLLILKYTPYGGNKMVVSDWNEETINKKLRELACKTTKTNPADVVKAFNTYNGKKSNGNEAEDMIASSVHVINTAISRSSEWKTMTFMLFGKAGISVEKSKGMILKNIEAGDYKKSAKNVLLICRGIYQAYLRICGCIAYMNNSGTGFSNDLSKPVRVDILKNIKVECPSCGGKFIFSPKCTICGQVIDYGIDKSFYIGGK